MHISFFPIPCGLSISCISAFPFLDWAFKDWCLFPSCSPPNGKDFPPHGSAILASFFHSEGSSQHCPFIHLFQPLWLPSILDCPLANAFLSSGFPLSFLGRVTPATSLLSFFVYFLCSWIHMCFPALILHVFSPSYRSKAFVGSLFPKSLSFLPALHSPSFQTGPTPFKLDPWLQTPVSPHYPFCWAGLTCVSAGIPTSRELCNQTMCSATPFGLFKTEQGLKTNRNTLLR